MSSFEEEGKVSKAVVSISKGEGNEGKMMVYTGKTNKPEKVRTILPEEEYLENLDKIITKNYFPEVPKMKAQLEYMDAVSRNDIVKMRELQARFNTQRRTERRTSPSHRRGTSPSRAPTSPVHFDPDTPGPSRADSPSRFSTVGERSYKKSDDDDSKKKKKDLDNLSVNAYLNKYTSEDNASFDELAALSQKKEREKNKWLYEAADKHNKELVVRQAIASQADVQLALKYHKEAINDKPLALDNWAYSTRNTLLFYPEGAELTKDELIQQAKLNQIVINKEGTRFANEDKSRPNQATMSRAAMMQAANNIGKVDITGREASMSAKQFGVLATPNLAPGVEDTPLMTWGEIDGTPFRLDGTDVAAPPSNAPAFKMPEVPQRELIAQGITDEISKKSRDRRKNAFEYAERTRRTPSFGSVKSSDKNLLLSPAARKLTNQLGIRLGSGSSSIKSPAGTPSSMRRHSSSKSSVCSSPSISSMIKRRETPKRSSITDNLMPISVEDETKPNSSRAKASDFF